MNIKVTAFAAMTLAALGYFFGGALAGGTIAPLTKAGCMASVRQQMDKDLFSQIDPAGMCSCLAALHLKPGDANFKTVQPCLDKNLRQPISDMCDQDEMDKDALRAKREKERGQQLTQVEMGIADNQPIPPAMNCDCVADKSERWVWDNLDASMRSKKLSKKNAKTFANGMVKECSWK